MLSSTLCPSAGIRAGTQAAPTAPTAVSTACGCAQVSRGGGAAQHGTAGPAPTCTSHKANHPATDTHGTAIKYTVSARLVRYGKEQQPQHTTAGQLMQEDHATGLSATAHAQSHNRHPSWGVHACKGTARAPSRRTHGGCAKAGGCPTARMQCGGMKCSKGNAQRHQGGCNNGDAEMRVARGNALGGMQLGDAQVAAIAAATAVSSAHVADSSGQGFVLQHCPPATALHPEALWASDHLCRARWRRDWTPHDDERNRDCMHQSALMHCSSCRAA